MPASSVPLQMNVVPTDTEEGFSHVAVEPLPLASVTSFSAAFL
jgi:hypothetical protein